MSIGSSGSFGRRRLKGANEFYNQNSERFNYLLAAFTAAVILSSGICLHEAHHRLFLAIPLLRLYRRLNRIRKQMAETAEMIIQQDKEFLSFSLSSNKA